MANVVLRLAMLALVCGLLVSATWSYSAATIVANRADHAARLLLDVAGRQDLDIQAIGDDRFRLLTRGEPVGFILPLATEAGYNGRISLWLAVDTEGKVLGVRVREHHETPGLGDKIELAVSPWIRSFEGRSLADGDTAWDVKRQGGSFDQFTGATITPRAVILAVEQGLRDYQLKRDEL